MAVAVCSAVLVGAGLAFDRAALGVVLLLFVLVVPLERRWPRHRQPLRREGLTLDLAHALASGGARLLQVAAGVVLAGLSGSWITGYTLRPMVAALPGWSRPLIGVLLVDLVVYWVHRIEHAWAPLWRFHRVHHSARYLDWISAFRNHPFDGLLAAPPIVALLVAGFPVEATGVIVVVQFATGILLHANVRWRLRPLHKIVATPEFHHWHHEAEPGAGATNLAAFLPVWDLLFGTYRMPVERRPARYGVSGAMATTLVGQWAQPFRRGAAAEAQGPPTGARATGAAPDPPRWATTTYPPKR
ncbi:MAG: sterol desaturase family protein [Acidimicrobiales bacterium]|nr:sterol desaturase family protein [Acidimicrobiales bacterium]